jgi:16S rRNA (cytosine1402-N4)-methyltransferase
VAEDESAPHRRRKRYPGTHPRSFRDKYKELDPARYGEDVAKVIARGGTPAGSHRSICVLETLAALSPLPGEVAIDATLGFGGHARAILAAILPGGRLYALDRDPVELGKTEARLRSEGFGEDVLQCRALNFASIPSFLAAEGIAGVDLVMADLGLSSMQIDNPGRGFTFKRDGPLDMRMNPSEGLSAAELLKRLSARKLGEILEANSDEPDSVAISLAINRHKGTIMSTKALAEAVREAFPGRAKNDPESLKAIRRTFQAIRIEVNGEFSALDALLACLPSCLKPHGRVAILSFHSGEDNRVARAFGIGLDEGVYSAISPEAIHPGREERYANPRSTSAKLRWALRA